MSRTRVSKRENESVSYQRECECTNEFPADRENENEIPSRLLEEINNNNFTQRGILRCLEERIIVKRRDSFARSKDRFLNIEFNDLESFGRLRGNHGIVVIKFKKVGKGFYQAIRLRTLLFSKQFCDQLSSKTPVNQLFGGDYGELHDETNTENNVNDRKLDEDNDEYEMIPRKTPIKIIDSALESTVEYQDFEMKYLNNFPRSVPNTVINSYDQRKLDNKGKLCAYEHEAILNIEGQMKWRSDYKEIKTIYLNRNYPSDILLAIENTKNVPKCYTLFRFNDAKTANSYLDIFSKNGTECAYIADAVHERPIDRSDTINQIRNYEKKTNNNVSRTSSLHSIRSGFSSINVRNIKRHASRSNYDFYTQNISSIPEFGEWDSDVVFLSDEGDGVSITDREAGNVFLYVAHRID